MEAVARLTRLTFSVRFYRRALRNLIISSVAAIPRLPDSASVTVASFILVRGKFSFFFLRYMFV